MADLVLAIDLGTSWCKAAYLDPQATLVAEGRSFTRPIRPAPSGMGDRYWAAVIEAVQIATSRLPHAARPGAIALSCRAVHGICLDEAGEEFFPVWDISLNRRTPEEQYCYSHPMWGESDPFAYGYGMSVASAAYLTQQRRPQEWQRIARIGSLHDYIVYKMTGMWVTDPTSGPSHSEWPAEVLALSGLPAQAFPHSLEPESLAGGLTDQAAQALGLPPGTPVVVGSSDGAAANLGTRATEAGDACITLGTHFVFRAVTAERLTTRCFSYRIAPGRWTWVSNVPIASPQLDIAAELLLPEVGEMAERHRRLGLLAAEVAPGCAGLVVPRVLSGQEAILRENLQEVIAAGYDKGAIYRALLEAIAYGVRDLVNRAKRDGVQPTRFVTSGGSTQNSAFLQVLTAVLDTPIEIGQAEAGLIGAGMMAALYRGWFATLDQAMAAMTSAHPVIYPDPAAIAYYRNQAP